MAATEEEVTSPSGRTIKRRDSIGERIEQSIVDHIEEETREEDDKRQEDANESRQLLGSSVLKQEVEEKIKSIVPTHQLTNVLMVISSLYKHQIISREARNVLKNQAIEEVKSPDGILSAAVELLCVDWDMDECVDTFVKVSQMLLAAA